MPESENPPEQSSAAQRAETKTLKEENRKLEEVAQESKEKEKNERIADEKEDDERKNDALIEDRMQELDDEDKAKKLSNVMETAADTGARVNFRGAMPIDNLDYNEQVKQQSIDHLEQLLASNEMSAVRGLTWLVAAPSCLDAVLTEPQVETELRNHLIVSLVAWAVLLMSGSLLLVTGFFQAPRFVGYAAGGCVCLACLAFAWPMFAPAPQEFAGHLTAPVLPPTGLRAALNMQQWVLLLAGGREELQDLLC
ncbi:hypothetical protein BOX15_Mlig024237g1 [Macrostomum lignano]|uniref:Uncharacterized protein n=1 Tax=Macrostomum lignano TaxID=282301 RepID=A0A267G6A5_9PLAT|nr:hypothetical protein BOX15_Mlig024237g1 [Macrostomum lignano]